MRDMSYFYCWETHFTPGMYNENCKRNKLYKKAVDEFLEEIASRLGKVYFYSKFIFNKLWLKVFKTYKYFLSFK